jgi:hypothetical protein
MASTRVFFRGLDRRAARRGYQPGELVEPTIEHPAAIDNPIADFRGCRAVPAKGIY